MTSLLQWQIVRDEGVSRVVFEGTLSENCRFDSLLGMLSGPVVLDLAGVVHVTSYGVREWIRFVTGLRAAVADVTLGRCSVPMVQQFGLGPEFLAGCRVGSVFAPYYCPGCSTEHARLCELSPEQSIPADVAPLCPKCGASLEFDDLPEQYFAFAAT